TEMIFAKLTRGIALGFQSGGERSCFSRYSNVCTGLADRRETRADWQFTRYEIRPAGRATCLGIIVSEHHAFRGQLVEVRRSPRHHASMVGADIEPANIVTHDDEYVRRPLLLLLRRGRQACK